MKSKFKILDICCGEGGAAMGYLLAASVFLPGSHIEIVGVDKRPMKRYPFNFIQCDALSLDYDFLLGFDFIHASPPCKPYTQLYRFSKVDTDKTLLPRILTTLEAAGKPYVVENVPQAPIRADIQLDGTMFDLPIKRRRIFQTNIPVLKKYPIPTQYSENLDVTTIAGNSATLEAASNAMNIYWMSHKGIKEAIPPAYTQWMGSQLFCDLVKQLD
jgi:hypothetical protein